MLVGSMAGNFWGIPRSTHDIDFVIEYSLHKLRWNLISPSDRQLNDVRGILQVSSNSIDPDYLMRWAERIGVRETLARIKAEVDDEANE